MINESCDVMNEKWGNNKQEFEGNTFPKKVWVLRQMITARAVAYV